jgi:outer membrane protein assembly factor BamD (BamD/ComL family)
MNDQKLRRGKAMKYRLMTLILFNLIAVNVEAAWIMENGEVMRKEDVAYFPPQEHYRLGKTAFDNGDWKGAIKHLHIVTVNCSDQSFGQDASFYLGIAYYRIGEYDLANTAFSQYLSGQSNPRYFQETIDYKFAIAEQFRKGARRHFYGSRHFPKWGKGECLALNVYDEVIAAMPSDDLAARALFSKACLMWRMGDYRDSVDTYQMLIRRFPKHELAPESYARIIKVYIDQSKRERQNPDILAFAEMNLSKFESEFPGEESLQAARLDYMRLKELYACGLYEIAIFYERVNHPEAAVIYYQKAFFEFPDTNIARRSRNRLARLCPSALTIPNPEERDDEEEDSSEVIEGIEFVRADSAEDASV